MALGVAIKPISYNIKIIQVFIECVHCSALSDMGRDTVCFGSPGFERSFVMKQEFRSRDYNTKLNQVITVFAK
ncbi:DUF4113 domain-containing protein [Sphingobacterium hungaricum]|uniref:DUF4113 domain-containing protein n=1 Tax=Sphingobacterium hungaricum TaxID=2082723 RepID=A0A928YQ50_9SPHI|nr:hypothetical protein [Sphingobacterium hungaricum]